MRKDSKQQRSISLAQVQGYHQGAYNGHYAYQGFTARKYFTSDRYIPLDENFQRPDGKPLQGYGLEIETECQGIRSQDVLAEVLDKIIFAQFPADLFKMQRDGSLGGQSSAECITQVMTKAFIRNQYQAFRAMYDAYFPAFQISCSASGACGMHVNVSLACLGKTAKAQEDATKKLLYIVNRHYDLICHLTARNPARTLYCSKMQRYTVKRNCQDADLSCADSDHGVCFNLGHYRKGRIELRIVGGQSTFGCFRNTMESVFHLVEKASRLPWSALDDVGLIFTGCNQYVFDRLNTKCKQAGVISHSQLEYIRQTVVHEDLV